MTITDGLHSPSAVRSRFFRRSLILLLLFATSAIAQQFPEGYVGHVAAPSEILTVGQTVTLTGSDLEPNTDLDLVWLTYDVDWHLGQADDGKYDGNYLGLESSPRERWLATVTTDVNGAFVTELKVPEDYGGSRTVLVRRDGVNINQVGLFVRPHMQLSPQSGPVGSDITVTVTGLDSGQPMGWYLLSYDHNITGFVSAVNSNGTARFTIPAVGAPGPHLVRLDSSPFGHPYMPLDTSPWAHIEMPSSTFTVSEGEPVLPEPLAQQVLPAQPGIEPEPASPVIWTDPVAAAVGTEAALFGKGFEPGMSLRFDMSNMIGSRVTESGFTSLREEFGEVQVEEDGTFRFPFTFPDTLGGQHTLYALSPDGEQELAETLFKVLPFAFELESRQVRYGDVLRLHLKGIGWSQTENIFGIVVDNRYIGYGCGFSTNGDVQVPIEVSWEPGWHFIDIYPSFYRNGAYSEADEAPFLFRQGLLSWQDHPSGFHFRYAFEVLPPEGEAN